MQEIKNVTMIGIVSKNLKQTDDNVVCYLIGGTAFGRYHGISIREHYKPFDTKKEAIESANKYYNDWAKEFPDNTKPFGLVLYMKGHGWLSMSSNLIDNELEIKQAISK